MTMEDDFKKAILLGGSVSQYARLMEEQSKIQKATSVVNKFFGNSILEKITQNHAQFKNPFSAITDSAVSQILMQNSELAVKLAKVQGQFSAVSDSISKIVLANDGFYSQLKKDVNPFERTFASSRTILEMISKENELAVKYTKFHKQFNSIVEVFNPSIASMIEQNVRIHFESNGNLNATESVLMESFELIKDDYSDAEQAEMAEFTEALKKNSKLKEIILKLFDGFYNAYLTDDFFQAIDEVIGENLSQRSKKTIKLSIVGVYLCFFHFKPYYDNYVLSQEIEKQNSRIAKIEFAQKTEPKEMSAQELDDCKELFFDQMNQLVSDFEAELLTKYKPQTVKKYTHIASAFVHYLHDHTNHIRFEDIKQSDTNSRFINASKWEGLDDIDKTEVQNKMKIFLDFLKTQGLKNKRIFK